MKYFEIIKKGQAILEEAGIPDADYDAKELFLYSHELDFAYYLLLMNREDEKKYEDLFFKLIKDRAKRIPLQHILGYSEFMGMRFEVSPAVLCPRDDTEILVNEVILAMGAGCKVLDLCTGSGCIIISIVKNAVNATGCGTDISEDALKVAKRNAAANDADVRFVCGDLFEAVGGEKYDIITANPPYIRSSDIKGLMPEVKDYDPLIALDGGEDGLIFYRRIISEAKAHLNPGGRIFMEIGFDQKKDVWKLLEENGFTDIYCKRDYGGNDRVMSGRKP